MEKKVVVITGASSGIGLALANEYASKGWDIVLAARSIDKLNEVKLELERNGAQVLVVKADVSVEADCINIIEQTIAKFGKIDAMINNAGISMRALFEDLDLNVIRQLMDVNFWGTVYCSKYALPSLLKSKGSLVGISSIAGYVGLPCRTGYSASKFAMHGLLETIRTENLNNGLHVLIACPGFTASNIRNTALSSNGSQQGESPRDEAKMMTAEEVAHRIAVAIDKRQNSLVMTTQGKLTVLLNKFIPKTTAKMVYNHMKQEANSLLR